MTFVEVELSQEDVKALARRQEAGEDVVESHYEDLYRYYSSNGEMPYGVAKARTGDPYQWISEQLEREI